MRYLLFLLPVLIFFQGYSQSSRPEGYGRTVSLNKLSWKIATDSTNTGIEKKWFLNPPSAKSRPTKIPWVIQDIFHDYHGVAWYWAEFENPENIPAAAKCLLKFHAVDYKAQIWLNGNPVGMHEGSEFAFELDVTTALKKGKKNLLVVRVLNPTYEPIDGISLKETPSSLKNYPFSSNAVYNAGGITGDVELRVVPPVRINDLFTEADWKTGKVKLHLTIKNELPRSVLSSLTIKITNERKGKPYLAGIFKQSLATGENKLILNIQVDDHQLWSPNDPVLYRVQAEVNAGAIDEQVAKFGFRDFRYEDGYFRLNGKRIFLKGCNFSTHYPVSYSVPLNEDMLRRDVVNLKALGFNFVRIPFGCANPRIMDLYDELGLLVHQEHYGSWQMGEFGKAEPPKHAGWQVRMEDRFQESVQRLIKRDRNHPSIVMWGCLNEMHDGLIFRKAVQALPELRKLDPTRVFVLNSGRFDNDKQIGSISNPGSVEWDVPESALRDWHPYVWMPYTERTLDELSGKTHTTDQKLFISETGLCAPLDLPSELGDYQRLGKEKADDARYFKRQFNKFLADWQRFDLGKIWSGPKEYIEDAYKTAGLIRETAESSIRSNPFLIAYAPTNGVADYSMGESIATNFRRLKPQLIRSVLLSNSDLRWCLRTEPQSIYSEEKINIALSISNLDVLKPGKYSASIEIMNPAREKIFTKKITLNIPDQDGAKQPAFAYEVWNETVTVSGRPGNYQVLVTLDEGATVDGGNIDFYVSERIAPVSGGTPVVSLGNDPVVEAWLSKYKITTTSLSSSDSGKRQLIIVSGRKALDSLTMMAIARQMQLGSMIMFLTPEPLKRGAKPTGWLPLEKKGTLAPMDDVGGYYRSDRWSKPHPFFCGLPTGGMMDYKYFRNVISKNALAQEYDTRATGPHTFAELTEPLTYPTETLCGAIRLSHTYCSGIQLGIWNFGAGFFVLNTLNIVNNLDKDPAADRLMLNLIQHGSKNTGLDKKPMIENFEKKLKLIGYN